MIFCQLFRSQTFGIHFDLCGFATCFYHSFQCLFFMRSISLYGVYKIGYQVCATLVLGFYIGPLSANILIHGDKTVIYTDYPYDKDSHNG